MSELLVFDAFAGVGGIRLGFEQASNDFRTVFAVDFEPKCKTTYDLNFDTTKLTVNDISKLVIEDIPNFDVITAGFPCFIAGTKVLTDSGYKNIESVNFTDRLMTHKGIYQKILNLQTKTYIGQLYTIRTEHNAKITCTPEHPYRFSEAN